MTVVQWWKVVSVRGEVVECVKVDEGAVGKRTIHFFTANSQEEAFQRYLHKRQKEAMKSHNRYETNRKKGLCACGRKTDKKHKSCINCRMNAAHRRRADAK